MTVDELLAQVNGSIDERGISVPEGARASRYVDLRAFRYYRSQGLVDPPIEKRGVAGLYGDRHVLQLVAIKSLQSRWMPLHEIRKRLANASDDELNALAGPADTPVTRAAKGGSVTPKPPMTNLRRTWIELRVNDAAFLMVDQKLLSARRPSELRAIGERVTSMLVAAGA